MSNEHDRPESNPKVVVAKCKVMRQLEIIAAMHEGDPAMPYALSVLKEMQLNVTSAQMTVTMLEYAKEIDHGDTSTNEHPSDNADPKRINASSERI